MGGAYAAVAQAGASIGVMVAKAGAERTQKLTPSKAMPPPLGAGTPVGGFYPQMSMRLRCGRLHGGTYESARNFGKETGLTDGRDGARKGGPACMALQLACCKH